MESFKNGRQTTIYAFLSGNTLRKNMHTCTHAHMQHTCSVKCKHTTEPIRHHNTDSRVLYIMEPVCNYTHSLRLEGILRESIFVV